MAEKRMWQVDAFADSIYKGNPCAVIFDAADLSGDQMQVIAAEMNLSETVFLLPPTTRDADYRVRIFTPRSELPFAGHPTISAAYCVHQSLVETGYGAPVKRLRQECGAGIIPVDVGNNGSRTIYTMTQIPATFSDFDVSREEMVAALGCADEDLLDPPIETANTGIDWMFARLKSPEVLAALDPDMSAIIQISRQTGITGLAVYSLGGTNPGVDVKLRAFAPAEGIPEDPVTGSANGCLAAVLARNAALGPAPISYVAEQGVEMGRDGRIYAAIDAVDQGPCIGGEVVRVMTGLLTV